MQLVVLMQQHLIFLNAISSLIDRTIEVDALTAFPCGSVSLERF